MLSVLDGAYAEVSEDELVFIDDLAEDMERRFVRWLKRHDLLEPEVIEPSGPPEPTDRRLVLPLAE